MKAIWKNEVLAQSDDTVEVEGNHYFPASSLDMTYFASSETTSHCGWKGEANYYDIKVSDEVNADAAWYYADPKQAASNIKGHVAFWRGVEVTA
ncbi:DUF427 domain-containing protein [Arenicella sp.]|nr:DUF427 domain-containing protein [Arenicella sp.]